MNKSELARRLLRWYDRHRRDLPWRVSPGRKPNAYHVLVSEFMLQQTQVTTVLPYFAAFVKAYPTLQVLARASERQILRLWQGLGYYSRARNLLAAAKTIVAEHDGLIPSDVQTLLKLPGLGRYTAGAVSSIAYDIPAPILDGNVARVLVRLNAIKSSPHESQTRKQLWELAAQIIPDKRCGDFNSAMMELGATVCTPTAPKCLLCPVRAACQAHAMGIQDQIPAPRKSKPSPLLRRSTFCLRRANSKWLIEQRPSRGRWAGMWQFVTAESNGSPVTAMTVRAVADVKSDSPRHLCVIEQALTHRRYRFDVYLCDVRGPVGKFRANPPRRWVRLDELRRYPLTGPQARIGQILRELP